MDDKIIKSLCDDEVVKFIAVRHRIEPETLLHEFLSGGTDTSHRLLDNEREILRGLSIDIIRNHEQQQA